MKNRTYAREVSKVYLQKLGVEHVSTDAKEIIVNGNIVIPIPTKNSKTGNRHYYNIRLYDEENDAIFDAGVHVLNYVWNKEDKPSGMVIDHIDNDANNNDISNLQCITPAENLAKEKPNWYTSETKCKLNKPRSFYQDKLEGYILAYEQAKKDHDAEGAHKLRSCISQTRARLRYYDNHITEAQSIQATQEQVEVQKREKHERTQKKKELQANIDNARKYYKQARDVYGEKDPHVKQLWEEWKLAISELHRFKEECARA
jgi:hypothetical protein